MGIRYYRDESLQEPLADLDGIGPAEAGMPNIITAVIRNEGKGAIKLEPTDIKFDTDRGTARLINWPRVLRPGEHGFIEFEVTPEAGQIEAIGGELRWRTTGI